jgi:carbamoyltransferase
MNILGLATIRDSAAALVVDGRIVSAVEEERFTRQKKQCGFPAESIKYCLDDAGLTLDDIDIVSVYWKPWMFRRMAHVAKYFFRSPVLFRAKASQGVATLADYRLLFFLRKKLGDEIGGTHRAGYKIRYLDHHLTHAASTFLVSPFERAAILTIDGSGETTATMLAYGEGKTITPLRRFHLPHSLGHLYAAVTRFLGFRKNRDEGKIMALASFGDPQRYYDTFRKIISLTGNGGYRMDISYFDQHLSRLRIWPEKTLQAFGASRTKDMPIEQRHQDIAAGLQKILEETVIHIAGHLYKKTECKNLCLAGGVALNCAMNGKVLSETEFEDIYIQPAAHDAGGALGSALYLDCSRADAKRDIQMDHAYLGPRYSEDECRKELDRLGCRYEWHEDIASKCASLLAGGHIIGWYQGAMEFGPRALGNRSIIADPRDPAMKDVLNSKVKFREEFRPFAPSVLHEYASHYFEDYYPSPFMLLVFKVRPERRDAVPAIMHVDGTARVQSVDTSTNKPYRRLIEEFYRITGVPMILNTSFNVRGEPIVCSPADAIKCFLGTDLDFLALGPYLAAKNPI